MGMKRFLTLSRGLALAGVGLIIAITALLAADAGRAEKAAGLARVCAAEAMEVIQGDVRQYPQARVEENGRRLVVMNERGRARLVFEVGGGALLRNRKPAAAGVAEVFFRENRQVIEVSLRCPTLPEQPDVTLFSTAKPGQALAAAGDGRETE